MNRKIRKSILATFIADAYCLGSHWIYDEKELLELPINWENFNDAEVAWHKGKKKGDFTHYGDQSLYLLEYITANKKFDKSGYYEFWKSKMNDYPGYIDGSTKQALEKIGGESTDLSICSRIAPLLICSKTKDDFLNSTKELIQITHNKELSITTALFFAELLWLSLNGNKIRDSIKALQEQYPTLKESIQKGINSKNNSTYDSIRAFGPACDIEGGFPGVIHLLHSHDEFKEIMIKNAKAGGDNSSRAMLVAMILATQDKCVLPERWINGLSYKNQLNKLLV